jgi:hypothetical protein
MDKRMASMNPVTYAAMVLLQRADEALRLERLRSRPDPFNLTLLERQKRRLRARLRRSLGAHAFAGS